jgi:S1-C subfamily serine protease
VGDIVVDVAGQKPASLAELWRAIWSLGPPGTEIPLRLRREAALVDARIHSADRGDFLKKPHLH